MREQKLVGFLFGFVSRLDETGSGLLLRVRSMPFIMQGSDPDTYPVLSQGSDWDPIFFNRCSVDWDNRNIRPVPTFYLY